jgi:predicted transcriptional regulator
MFTPQSTANYGLLERMSIKSTLTTELVKAARMLLGWGQDDLAEKSGVSWSRIKHLEAKPGQLRAYPSTIAAIRTAFEDAGIEFSNGDSPGVKLHTIRAKTMRSRKPTPIAVKPKRVPKSVKAIKRVLTNKTQPKGLR